MKRNTIIYFIAINFIISPAFINITVASAPDKTKIMADACLTCHGPNGMGVGKIPELKGLEKDDITESLFGFRSGDEKSTIMGRYAKALSDNEINMLAEYFAALK